MVNVSGVLGAMGVLSEYNPGDQSSRFDIENLLTNAGSTLAGWAKLLMIIIGIIMVVVGVYQIAKGLMSGGGQRGAQTNWIVAILLIVLGGALGFFGGGGWDFVVTIAQGGKKTINDLAQQSVILDWLRLLH